MSVPATPEPTVVATASLRAFAADDGRTAPAASAGGNATAERTSNAGIPVVPFVLAGMVALAALGAIALTRRPSRRDP
jgi:hypothetical protein